MIVVAVVAVATGAEQMRRRWDRCQRVVRQAARFESMYRNLAAQASGAARGSRERAEKYRGQGPESVDIWLRSALLFDRQAASFRVHVAYNVRVKQTFERAALRPWIPLPRLEPPPPRPPLHELTEGLEPPPRVLPRPSPVRAEKEIVPDSKPDPPEPE
jgi:hypothetical protein